MRITGKEPDIRVQPCRLGVVIAGADVHVPSDAVNIAPHHQHRLGVRLEPRQSIRHVDAVVFHRARESDVVLLVEPRLQLDDHRHLLAGFGSFGERSHDRRVARRAIQREFDGQHLRIARRSFEKCFDRRTERLVRMMDEHIALADHVEDVPTIPERRRYHRRVRHIAKLRHLETGNLQQIAQLQQIVPIVHVARGERGHELRLAFTQLLEQQLPHGLRHIALHLEPYHFAEATLEHLLFDRLEQIVRLVDLSDVQVGVARDAKGEPPFHVHAREQRAEMLADHFFQRHIAVLAVALDRHPARQ